MIALIFFLTPALSIFVFAEPVALLFFQFFRFANSMRLFCLRPYTCFLLESPHALLTKFAGIRLRAYAFAILKFSLGIGVARVSIDERFNLVLSKAILVCFPLNQRLFCFWDLAVKFEAVSISFFYEPVYFILIFAEGEFKFQAAVFQVDFICRYYLIWVRHVLESADLVFVREWFSDPSEVWTSAPGCDFDQKITVNLHFRFRGRENANNHQVLSSTFSLVKSFL